jgi:glycosyltransferase involved in cell wall biosynthesis
LPWPLMLSRAGVEDNVKHVLRESPRLQRLMMSAMVPVGRWQARRGRDLSALDVLMRAWRHATKLPFDASGRAAVESVIRRACYSGDGLAPIAGNALIPAFLETDEARRIRRMFDSVPVAHRVRLRLPRVRDYAERQGNLMLLKRHNPATGEKGVILLKYSQAFLWFVTLFDIAALASRYTVVLEPCYVGYPDKRFLLLLGSDLDVLVFAPFPPDYEFIRQLDSNLVPVELGAGDWVDPDSFKPGPRSGRTYDLAMVAFWGPLKRHKLLFRTLSDLERRGHRDIRVALVGYPSTWKRNHIERLMRRYGVQEQCEVFEGIPHKQVANILSDSRAALLLSRQEGTSKSFFEALFCDTPVIVTRDHRGGINQHTIPDDVVVLAGDDELDCAILSVMESPERFRAREWAASRTGWPLATRRLNEALEEMARQRGQPWTHPIVPKKNAPNLMYAEEGRYREFEEEYASLEPFLRP